jgi:hypothetical protein
MAQHFLLSAAARSLNPGKVMRMSDGGAENLFLRLRWPQTDGKPVCPRCGCLICYDCRRSDCQIASNSDPLFASNIDPLSGTVWSLSMSCIGGTRARSAAPQALRGAKGAGGPCASRG